MRSTASVFPTCTLMSTRRRRKRKEGSTGAIAVLDMGGITGTVQFEKASGGRVKVAYEIRGLAPGKHGFHIHKYGDLRDGCDSACSHFNPSGNSHGGPRSKVRHAGDLGNVLSVRGISRGSVTVSGISLNPASRNSIIGRSIVLHEHADDLGRGGTPESLKTGSAGKRLACAVIGISNPSFV